jgi:hypothetical protein
MQQLSTCARGDQSLYIAVLCKHVASCPIDSLNRRETWVCEYRLLGRETRVQGLESSGLIGAGAFRCPFKILRLPSTPPGRAFPCRSYSSLAAYSPFPGRPSIRNGRSASAMQVFDHASDLVSPTGDSGATSQSSPCSHHLDAMDPYRAAQKYIPL